MDALKQNGPVTQTQIGGECVEMMRDVLNLRKGTAAGASLATASQQHCLMRHRGKGRGRDLLTTDLVEIDKADQT
jgi:hypothetical protein